MLCPWPQHAGREKNMLLAIDIGNTNITIGMFEGERLVMESRLATDRKRTSDQYAIELMDILRLNGVQTSDIDGAIISSVVPELTSPIKDGIRKLVPVRPLVVGPGIKTGLNIKTDNHSQLGADLVAAAVAAIENYRLPCIVFDLGTATTISVIDETGSFTGCIIAAGVATSIDALSSRTAMLPHISIEAPPKVIGTNTPDCMRSGAVFGAAAMLDGLAERIERELGVKASLVATGGLAREIIKHCYKKVEFSDNLLLEGLRIIYDRNR